MKEEIRQLIAAGTIDQAIARSTELARQLQAPDLLDDCLLLSARWQTIAIQERRGTEDPALLLRERNAIAESVLQLVEAMPEEPELRKKVRGVPEQTLKNRLFFTLLFVKAGILGWLFTHYEAGGFSRDQFTGAIALLIPVFVPLGVTMFGDFLAQGQAVAGLEGRRKYRLIRHSLQWTVLGIILGYGWLLCWIVGAKARGTLSYEQMTTAFALVESLLGGYLVRTVEAFFAKK